MPLRVAAQKRLGREPLLTLGDQDVPSWTSLAFVWLDNQVIPPTHSYRFKGCVDYALTAEAGDKVQLADGTYAFFLRSAPSFVCLFRLKFFGKG